MQVDLGRNEVQLRRKGWVRAQLGSGLLRLSGPQGASERKDSWEMAQVWKGPKCVGQGPGISGWCC